MEQDILAPLAEMTDFLLWTSVLDRLYGGLCEGLTGRPGAGVMLRLLERRELFLMSDQDGPTRGGGQACFAYDRAFRDLLHGAASSPP